MVSELNVQKYKNKFDKINVLVTFAVFAGISERALFRWLTSLLIKKRKGISIKLNYFPGDNTDQNGDQYSISGA